MKSSWPSGTKASEYEYLLEDIIGADEEGNNVMLIDVVGCEDDISKKKDLAVESVKLKSYIELALSPRERKIIKMRYGLDNLKKYTR
jgi:RNA polymerase sporulation-specific sigma factor